MLFENENIFLEIFIGGYSDRPWYFKDEHMGRNVLACQVTYDNSQTGRNFVMWNEILQTEDIVCLRDGLKNVLSEVEDKFIFHSDYDTFALAIGVAEVGYDVHVQVQNIEGNIGEWFSMSQEAITEVLNYLSECCEKYPVR